MCVRERMRERSEGKNIKIGHCKGRENKFKAGEKRRKKRKIG